MTYKIKTTKTVEQRRTKAAELHATITAEVAALCDSVAWQRFLTFARAFHAYSLNNVLLILSQQPTATCVAGFRKWQELGRQVRKGERSIKIFGYAERKATDDEVTEHTKRNTKGEPVIPYFPMLSVFDIAQTDAMENWTDPDITQRLSGTDEGGIYAATADYLTTEGWTVEREQIPGETNGYTTMNGRRIVIDTELSDAQAAKTILHETAHALLHVDDEHGQYIAHRSLKECEAESVAYIVAGIFGLDTSIYSVGYIAGWVNGDTKVIRATAARVLHAAHKIADAITEPQQS